MNRIRAVLLCSSTAVLFVACGGFDKEQAAVQIRERFCRDWPYGCTEATEIEVDKVRKANEARSVDFRIVEGGDETEVVSAAYFQPADNDGWDLVFFEDPFRSSLDRVANRVAADRKEITDLLLDLKSAQEWYHSVHSRYAPDLDRLSRDVSYTPPESGMRMTTAPDGSTWEAEARGRFVHCELTAGAYLPQCVAETEAGARSGHLREAFSTD